MRRKLGFCLAMLPNPKLLVLDEPSTGVDPVSRVDLWRLVSEAAAHGAAVIMSTTYLDEAERCATLLVLDKGRTLLKGPPRDVVASLSGTVVATTSPVRPEFGWRRGQQFLEWWPAGQLPTDGTAIEPDLEDVVIAASMEVRLTAGARR
jgi:ABC-2 type transport system ATP-binding protein